MIRRAMILMLLTTSVYAKCPRGYFDAPQGGCVDTLTDKYLADRLFELERRMDSLEEHGVPSKKAMDIWLKNTMEENKKNIEASKKPCLIMSCTAMWCSYENPDCNTCMCEDSNAK